MTAPARSERRRATPHPARRPPTQKTRCARRTSSVRSSAAVRGIAMCGADRPSFRNADAEFFETTIECGTAQSQQLRCFLDVAVTSFERAADHVLFDIAQTRRRSRTRDRQTEVELHDFLRDGGEHRA